MYMTFRMGWQPAKKRNDWFPSLEA